MGIQILEYDSPVAAGSVMLTLSVENEAADASVLYTGASLADRMNRDLLIVHAVHEPGDKPGLYRQLDPQQMHVPLRDLALNICRRRIEAVQSNHPELKSLRIPSLFVIPGLPATRILQIAKSTLACCIVMQKSQHSALNRLMHTPISESVIKHAICPVVLIDSGKADSVDSLLLDLSHCVVNRPLSTAGRTPMHTPV